MAVEAKEVLEFLGYKPEDIKSIDDLKTNFDKEFVRAKNITEDSEFVKPILGKTYGTLENEVKKSAKSLGLDIDFESEEFKGQKKATDKFAYVIKKLAEVKDATIDELKANSGKGNDEKIRDWETKYNKLKKSKEDSDNLLGNLKTEYDTYKQTTANEIKGATLSVLKKDHHSKIKFKNDISELERVGYFTRIQEKYNLDVDDEGKIIPMDKKGNKIPSTKVTGTFKSYDEVLEEEAIATKVYALNPDGGKAKPGQLNFGAKQQQAPQKPARQVAPRLG